MLLWPIVVCISTVACSVSKIITKLMKHWQDQSELLWLLHSFFLFCFSLVRFPQACLSEQCAASSNSDSCTHYPYFSINVVVLSCFSQVVLDMAFTLNKTCFLGHLKKQTFSSLEPKHNPCSLQLQAAQHTTSVVVQWEILRTSAPSSNLLNFWNVPIPCGDLSGGRNPPWTKFRP